MFISRPNQSYIIIPALLSAGAKRAGDATASPALLQIRRAVPYGPAKRAAPTVRNSTPYFSMLSINSRIRGSLGASKISSFVPWPIMPSSVINRILSAASFAKPIS